MVRLGDLVTWRPDLDVSTVVGSCSGAGAIRASGEWPCWLVLRLKCFGCWRCCWRWSSGERLRRPESVASYFAAGSFIWPSIWIEWLVVCWCRGRAGSAALLAICGVLWSDIVLLLFFLFFSASFRLLLICCFAVWYWCSSYFRRMAVHVGFGTRLVWLVVQWWLACSLGPGCMVLAVVMFTWTILFLVNSCFLCFFR